MLLSQTHIASVAASAIYEKIMMMISQPYIHQYN